METNVGIFRLSPKTNSKFFYLGISFPNPNLGKKKEVNRPQLNPTKAGKKPEVFPWFWKLSNFQVLEFGSKEPHPLEKEWEFNLLENFHSGELFGDSHLERTIHYLKRC